ncbi:cytochrome c oxidase subunit 4 isoform 1, mitochondrial [Ixodes scapularis]|uniref:cytochrome c oxidase subunit 4 isoform 1, mitochondrial n=1 Tax=Ixodes scapularis TaxID=6945 RepID=UPI001A9D1C11|nr:cytochrome c oxidase subunit 4 isoform 1, mitochondrial [Ixodes scapularis]XP_029835972.2 cytochrome c oxidase subunit 4 isoform 1, mitochondrial [Ixodes scapularis]XP_029835973.2 cytochrome c oxidase subunit 4 isoform 1, mitochondrial [Ixodes scapularis]XP_040356335.1 cytochrome c oxidase subunit 4 isoform 1, mitochondrial [Ixodes scapularis]
MASRLLQLSERTLKLAPVVARIQPTAAFHGRARIGKREVVGYGMNGEYVYIDQPEFPMPAIRYKEPTAEIEKLREKEKGDWKNLSLEEKKALYRFSFCQTYAEMKASRNEWKPIVAGVLTTLGVTLWVWIFLKKFVYGPLPESCSPAAKEAQLKRMIDLRVNPIDGVASKWDYENNRWK